MSIKRPEGGWNIRGPRSPGEMLREEFSGPSESQSTVRSRTPCSVPALARSSISVGHYADTAYAWAPFGTVQFLENLQKDYEQILARRKTTRHRRRFALAAMLLDAYSKSFTMRTTVIVSPSGSGTVNSSSSRYPFAR